MIHDSFTWTTWQANVVSRSERAKLPDKIAQNGGGNIISQWKLHEIHMKLDVVKRIKYKTHNLLKQKKITTSQPPDGSFSHGNLTYPTGPARLGALNPCSLWWYNKHTTTKHVWCLGWKMLEDLRIFFWRIWVIFFWHDLHQDAFNVDGESTVSLRLLHFWWYQCRIRSFGAMSCQYPLSRHIFALNLPDHELHNCHNEAFFYQQTPECVPRTLESNKEVWPDCQSFRRVPVFSR